MSVKNKFEGKRVLLTGTTGFLGKVLLEKMLFSLSCVDHIYVLIREKAGISMQERFKKEIVSSVCFDRLRKHHRRRFDGFIQQKVTPIKGDLEKEGLGLTPEDLTELVQRCHIIINCAASIDFNARIDDAINSNIRGSLRMLELAKKINKLEIFTHISTCYVNCDRIGRIKEEIIDRGTNPEDELRQLEAMQLSQLIANTPKILGKFPNTYTFTKNLCERLMKARQGCIPLCIVRPAIINASYAEPFPGWIDNIAATAGLFLVTGLGIMKVLHSKLNNIADNIPVDFVAATIIVASAFNLGNKSLPIYHSGSSDRNPLTWGDVKKEVENFWNSNPAHMQVGKADILVTDSLLRIQLRRLTYKLPLEIYRRLSPLLSKQTQRNLQRLAKGVNRAEEVNRHFSFFGLREWIFECNNFQHLWDFLTPLEREEYLIDIAKINMNQYIRICNYGIQKYITKEGIDLHTSSVLKLHPGRFFSDSHWAQTTEKPINANQAITEIKKKILSSKSVRKAMEAETQRRGEGKSVLGYARRVIDELVGEIHLAAVRTMAWSVHKIFTNIFEKLTVNTPMMEQLREIEKRNIPIVLLPTRRSHLDFMVVSYICFCYKLRQPNLMVDEALLQAQIVPFLTRSTGACFFQRFLKEKSALNQAIFHQYLQLLLCQGSTIQFFISGALSHTGKISPNFDLLNAVLAPLLNGKVSEVCLVPLTINYENVVEDDALSELSNSVLRHNYGRVDVHICQPLMARQFIEDFKALSHLKSEPELQKELTFNLGREVIGRMVDGTVIMSTAMVSSVLLMHRQGIIMNQLVNFVNEIAKYIISKGLRIGGVNENSSSVAVRKAIGVLKITTKPGKDILEFSINSSKDLPKLLMLSHYRRTLVHAFMPEAFVGCALAALGELSSKEGAEMARVHEQSRFLTQLLRNQFELSYSLDTAEDFAKVVRELQERQVVRVHEGRLTLCPAGLRMMDFYCSLLRAWIDCYWACMAYALSVLRTQDHRYASVSLDNFYETVRRFIKTMYEEKLIEDYETCSVDYIRRAFTTFEQDGLLRISIAGKQECEVSAIVPFSRLEDIEANIKCFRNSIHPPTTSPQLGKPSLQLEPKL